jgi:hypothetical protein
MRDEIQIDEEVQTPQQEVQIPNHDETDYGEAATAVPSL